MSTGVLAKTGTPVRGPTGMGNLERKTAEALEAHASRLTAGMQDAHEKADLRVKAAEEEAAAMPQYTFMFFVFCEYINISIYIYIGIKNIYVHIFIKIYKSTYIYIYKTNISTYIYIYIYVYITNITNTKYNFCYKKCALVH